MQSPKQLVLTILFGYYIVLFYFFGVWMVSLAQPMAYMVSCSTLCAVLLTYQDEPFHEKQTIAYCEGKWTEWDPKITTFPGLYEIFFFLFKKEKIESVGTFFSSCSTYLAFLVTSGI
jgi:hypothetical protein